MIQNIPDEDINNLNDYLDNSESNIDKYYLH
jgi:hypothetical protein